MNPVAQAVTDPCRHCGSTPEALLDLGPTPQVDRLWPDQRSAIGAPRHPLLVARCPRCSLVQLAQSLPPEQLFGCEYRYCSSVSSQVLDSALRHAQQLIATNRLGAQSLVIEAASNDGYQLRWFAEAQIPVLGIEPAPLPAAAAREQGIDVVAGYFGLALAQELVSDGLQADLFLAKNVLAHVPEPHDFLAGVACLLQADGLACFEFPYLGSLLSQGQFDTIYHEHRCYLSLRSFAALLGAHGLYVHRVNQIPLHGGSLRVEVRKSAGSDGSFERLAAIEDAAGVNQRAALAGLADKITQISTDLRLAVLAEQRPAAYAAAAKGVVMLNCSGLDQRHLDYVVDANPHKIGRYMPGTGLLIRHPRVLVEEQPAAVVLLAWNHAAEIIAANPDYAAAGGRWIVPAIAAATA